MRLNKSQQKYAALVLVALCVILLATVLGMVARRTGRTDGPASTAKDATGPAASVDTAVGKRDNRAIYDASVDATVSITAKFADDSVGTASGFFLRDDGYVCTCAHAIQRPRTVENDDGELVLDMARVDEFPELATEIKVTVSAAGGLFSRFVSYDADIVGIDGRGDVAVLRVEDLETVNPCLDLIRTNRWSTSR